MFVIDGLTWDIKCDITRTSEVRGSDISGVLQDGSYLNDVMGTYLLYEITIPAPMYLQDKYAQIYEMLTEPVDGHTFVLPYNGGLITLTARVEQITDIYVEPPGGRTYWKDTKFTVVSNHPSKQMSLGQVLTRGRAPLPDVANPSVGDTYTWDGTGWTTTTLPDADNIAY